jgi:hypothetical protein
MDATANFQRQIREVIEATHFTEDGFLSWFGATTHIDCHPEEIGGRYREELATVLYRDFYTRGRATPSPPEHRLAPADIARRNMVVRYTDVVPDSLRVLRGVPVLHSTETHIQVDFNGLRVEVPVERIVEWESATKVALALRRLSSRLSPGFVVIFGDWVLNPDDRGLRVYLNTTPDGAVECMRLLTTSLNDVDVAFAFKALDDSSRFSRADACVLYTAWDQRELVGKIVIEFGEHLGNELKPAVPALTLPIAPGIGIAQGPGDDSFGRARSSTLADALVSAWESGMHEVAEREAFVADFCRSRGVDLQRPYLQPTPSEVRT